MKTYNELLEETKSVREDIFNETLKGNLEIIEKNARCHLLCCDEGFSFTFPSFISEALIQELKCKGYIVELKGTHPEKFWVSEIFIHLKT